MTVITALPPDDQPPRPKLTRLQLKAFEKGRAIRHGDQAMARRIETELAEAELFAACDRYYARTGRRASRQLANRVSTRLTTGV